MKNFGILNRQVLLPHRGEVHTDHRVVFDAASACCKWFRYTSVRRVLAYETLSETDFGLDLDTGFHPNVFIYISSFFGTQDQVAPNLQKRARAIHLARSLTAVRTLAEYQSATGGFEAGKALRLLKERE